MVLLNLLVEASTIKVTLGQFRVKALTLTRHFCFSVLSGASNLQALIKP